jgi:hypothetical protein
MVGGLFCTMRFKQMFWMSRLDLKVQTKLFSLKSSLSSFPLANLLTLALAVLLFHCKAYCHPIDPSTMRDLYQIRIANRTGGFVEIGEPTADGKYYRIGTVLRPAVATVRGFAASVYADVGTVAAVAVHGIRIKVSGAKDCRLEETRMISILPKEFAKPPKGFGGHDAGASGICTDIPTGESIFRNLAPFVGNPVFLVRQGNEKPLPPNYFPSEGDILLIKVQIPIRYPREILIENRVGGKVRVIYEDGEQTVATVANPVKGVGRFDATAYTGVGRINTNHSGVITISTAPITFGDRDGTAVENRGGFMIQPSRHARLAGGMPQVMVVAPVSPSGPWLEGTPPLFRGYIGLAYYPDNENESFHVEVKTEKTGWMPLPPIIGKVDNALMKLPGGFGSVTDIKIRFPRYALSTVKAEIERCWKEYFQRRKTEAQKSGNFVTNGIISVGLGECNFNGICYVCLYVDGDFHGVSNDPTTVFSIDVSKLVEGEHLIEIRGFDSSGRIIKSVKKTVFIQYSDAVSR